MLKFYYNGIKVDGGKLQKASYGGGPWVNKPADTITIYARGYNEFSKEVYAAFTVENMTDMRQDYFEKDKIRVHSNHPLYSPKSLI